MLPHRLLQQILVQRHPARLKVAQEGGHGPGITDAHAAVPGGYRHPLRHPVPLLVTDRLTELLRGGVDGILVVLDGRAPRVAQPVSVQVAEHSPG